MTGRIPAGRGARRRVRDPVFILSAPRSGSTLLRVILDGHSRLCAPHELHLKDIEVALTSPFARQSMAELGLGAGDLRYLLWDRLMDELLRESGKAVLVNKTPTDVLVWEKIAECWPDARYVFLLRHPAAIAASWHRAQVHWTFDQAVEDTLRYLTALEEARRKLPGPTVRFEDLTVRPAEVVRAICDFLGVAWEPGMPRYRVRDFKPGIGDWSARIRSGRPQPAPPPPKRIPEALQDVCRSLGYA